LTIAIVETIIAFAVIILLQVVNIVQVEGHKEAGHARDQIEALLALCSTILSEAKIKSVNLDEKITSLSSSIRFSERLRKDSELYARVKSMLEQILSMLCDGSNLSEMKAELSRIIREAEILSETK
jgi:hypothetical protein